MGRTAILGVAAVVTGIMTFVAPTAGAEEGSITVRPFTDVVEGTEVSVQATAPEQPGVIFVLLICALDADFITGEGCTDIGGPSGNSIDTTFTARRIYHMSPEPLDCAVDPCQVVFVGVDSVGVPPVFLITHPFDVRLGPESLVVEPSSDLADGQTVEINVIVPYFRESALAVCASDAVLDDFLTAANRCKGIDLYFEQTTITEMTTVHTILVPELGGDIDCRVVGCEIVFAGGNSMTEPIDYTLHHPIEFGAPSFAVTPAVGLADGQLINIEAANRALTSGATAIPAQCGLRALDYAQFFCLAGGDIEADFDGDYAGTIAVQRFIPASDGGDPVDCALPPGRCAVFLAVLGTDGVFSDLTGAVISFTAP